MADDISLDIYDDEDIAAFAGHAQARKALHDVYGPAVEAPTEEDERVLAEWRRRRQSLNRFRELVGGDLGADRTGQETGIDQAAAAMGYDLGTWVGQQQRDLDALALRWDATARAGAPELNALQRDWHAKAQLLEQELEGVYGSSVDRDAVRAWLADRRTQIDALARNTRESETRRERDEPEIEL